MSHPNGADDLQKNEFSRLYHDHAILWLYLVKSLRPKWFIFAVALTFMIASVFAFIGLNSSSVESASNIILVQNDSDLELLPEGLERLGKVGITEQKMCLTSVLFKHS